MFYFKISRITGTFLDSSKCNSSRNRRGRCDADRSSNCVRGMQFPGHEISRTNVTTFLGLKVIPPLELQIWKHHPDPSVLRLATKWFHHFESFLFSAISSRVSYPVMPKSVALNKTIGIATSTQLASTPLIFFSHFSGGKKARGL